MRAGESRSQSSFIGAPGKEILVVKIAYCLLLPFSLSLLELESAVDCSTRAGR
jgi:hypothetical protein